MENQSADINGTQDHQGTAFTPKITLYSILLICSLLGNILVIAVVFGNRKLRTNFNYLIVNMAVSDLFIPLLILPLKITQEVNGPEWLVDGRLGNALCKLCFFLTDISPAVSIFSLVLITVNRFVSITFPMKSQILRGKISWILIIFTWVAAMALFSPYFYTFRLTNAEGFTQCISVWTPAFDDTAARTLFISIIIVVAFIVPLITIIVLYSIMLHKLSKSSKRVAHMLNNRQILSRQRRNKHILSMCVVIIAVFIVLLGPFFCFMFVVNFFWRWNFAGKIENVRTALFVVQFLGYSNTAINPCIYFVFLKEYREGLKKLLKNSNKKSSSFLSRPGGSSKLSTLIDRRLVGSNRRLVGSNRRPFGSNHRRSATSVR